MPGSTRKAAAPLRSTAGVVASLKRLARRSVREGMARYAIPSDNALGVTVGHIRELARKMGRDHDLALKLWTTGIYEARMLCAFIDDPEKVTPAQMDRWCGDFDNWAVCDTLCFHLFDRTPHCFRMIARWSRRKGEFQKRAAFALIASAALHDKQADDGQFARCLPLIEKAATDDRNFVKKGVSWALRGVGRRSPALHGLALALARRLVESGNAASAWVGRDVLCDITRPAVLKRLARRPSKK